MITLLWDDCLLQWLNITPCTVQKIQVLALICCKRKIQQRRCCLQKSLSCEWQCAPLSPPACHSWMGSLTLMGYSTVGDPLAALADIHLHSPLPRHLNTIAAPSVAGTKDFLSGIQLKSEWVWGGEMGMNHVLGMVGMHGGGERAQAEECCRAQGKQVQQLPQGA